MDLDLAPAIESFLEEAADFVVQLESDIMALEETPDDQELINSAFRAAHTIKGSGGLFGFDQLVSFTHVFESVLMRMRDGTLQLNKDISEVMLAGVDHLGQMLKHIDLEGEHIPEDISEASGQLCMMLEMFLENGPAQQPAVKASTETVQKSASADENIATSASDYWHLSLRFGPDVLRCGMDPQSFLRYLQRLGEIVYLETITDSVPTLDTLDAESSYFGFEIALKSEATREEIAGVFEFVEDQSIIRIIPPNSQISEFLENMEILPESSARLGDILVQCGALTNADLQWCLTRQNNEADESSEAPKLGEVAVTNKMATEKTVDGALKKQSEVRRARAAESQTLRVDSRKLDLLINLIGELVISGATTRVKAERTGDEELLESLDTMAHLIEEVRDSTLNLRMMPIAQTFSRFGRVVRDVSKQLNKDIQLITSGEDTEVDKGVLEKIADPLMHLMRNAMDHGIEMPDEREAAGKSRQGMVRLSAHHESGNVVIQIKDDGKGIHRDRIIAKAIENGLIESDEGMSDKDVYNLIFEAGFSTAAQVSDLSGRGVGMDVVRRNIESLSGEVTVDSEKGKGSTFTIRLPLTLAIIDGFRLGIDNSIYLIPLDNVTECVEIDASRRKEELDKGFLNLRGQLLPVLKLREMFGVESERPARENIVVVELFGRKAGIVIDRPLGEFQTVIKPLSPIFQKLSWVSGSTILGTGEVALILDVAGLLDRATRTFDDKQIRNQNVTIN